MKKLSILLVVFMLVGVTAMAQVEGLYVGAEIVVIDVMDDDIALGIRPYVGYEAAIMDEALEVVAELGFDIGIPTAEGADTLMGIDLLLGGLYNISLSDASKLGFGLNVYVFFPIDDKKGMWTNQGSKFLSRVGELQAWVAPVIKFSQEMGFGKLYAGLEVPIIVAYEGDAADLIMTIFNVGAVLEMGLDVGITHYGWAMNDGLADYWHYLEIYGKYNISEAIMAGLTIGVPLIEDGIKYSGIDLTLEGSYALDMGLKIYGELGLGGVGSDGDMTLGITIGAKYSF